MRERENPEDLVNFMTSSAEKKRFVKKAIATGFIQINRLIQKQKQTEGVSP